ncbi:MAG: hypothetical protein ACREP8_12940, partial [Candidatus Binatia bacterium]
FILLRLAAYGLFGLALILYFVVVYFVGQAGAALHEYVRVGIWIVALILPFPLVKLFREYVLYVIKIGHVAVIVRFALHGDLPEGVSQVAWGKEQVMKRFKETSVLFVVDRLVAGVINAINGMMRAMGNMLSGVPGVGGMVRLAQGVLRFSLTYVDEAVLARNFFKEGETVWESAKTGLVLYAQTWREILKTALVLGIAALVGYGVLLVLFLIPALGLGGAYPSIKIPAVIAAFILAAVLKLALLDPWALTNMILLYIHETKDLAPNAEWENKLAKVSAKFRRIQQQAASALPSSI